MKSVLTINQRGSSYTVIETDDLRYVVIRITDQSMNLIDTIFDSVPAARSYIASQDTVDTLAQSGVIPLAEWCKLTNMDLSNARKYCREGRLTTAHKVGRDWFINASDRLIDRRFTRNNEV